MLSHIVFNPLQRHDATCCGLVADMTDRACQTRNFPTGSEKSCRVAIRDALV